MNAFEYVTAESFDAALAYLAKQKPGDVLVKAGGIDVVDRLKERIDTPKTVLNLRQLRNREKPITTNDAEKSIVIDTFATLAQLTQSPLIREKFPALAHAAGEAATPQVRNVATIGGNLCQKPRCWYFRSQDFHCLKKGGSTCYAVEGDNRFHAILGAGACHIVYGSNAAIPLLAYGAVLRLVRSDNGKTVERKLPLDEFYRVSPTPTDDENVLAAGELIRELELPLSGAGPRSAYVEVNEKQSFDWALASCAVNWNDRAKPRVFLGAVAPIPWRLKNVEALIAGQKLNDDLIIKARAAAVEGAKPMSRNGYKVNLVAAVVERALREADAAA